MIDQKYVALKTAKRIFHDNIEILQSLSSRDLRAIFSQPIFLPEGQKDQLGISKQGLKIGDFHSGVFVNPYRRRHSAMLLYKIFGSEK